MNWRPILVGAVTGFVGAFVADLDAYASSPDDHPFNWKKAIARWVKGAVSGAATAAGITAIS